MKHSGLLFGVVTGALVLSGCAKNIDNKEAIREGVRKSVAAKGIDPSQMDLNVTSAQFHGTTADATVSFAAKGQPGGGITVNYQLERVKDEWIVKSRTPMNTLGHTQGSELPGKGGVEGATGAMSNSPDGHMMPGNGGKQPLDKNSGVMKNSSQSTPLPPGHPAMGTSGQKQ